MMNFYEMSSLGKIVVLVLSQFTVISLTAGMIILYKRKSRLLIQLIMCSMFLINMILYVLMQLDNHVVSPDRNIQLQIPWVLLLFVISASLGFMTLVLLNETKNRKAINQRSIKESFDTLPTGVCYFNEAGLPVLCNQAMQRFSFAICGKDVQYITDLENCLSEKFISSTGASKDGNVFVLSNGDAWQLKKRCIIHENEETYIQYVAANVTDLYDNHEELMRENEQLRKVQAELQKLSANVVTVTREEEILNTKMRVHDEMGRCLVVAQKYLQEEREDSIPDSVAHSWKYAVARVKYNNDIPKEDMLSQIRKACELFRLTFIQDGNLPQQEKIAYIFTCAIRECVTNAVRYAKADALYATFTENENESRITVTNSGIQPEKEIVEGGGLSNLRNRVERVGGLMQVQSTPQFKLTIRIPKEKEGAL